jgi:hypothetical protein
MLVPELDRHIAGRKAKARCEHEKHEKPTHDEAQ